MSPGRGVAMQFRCARKRASFRRVPDWRPLHRLPIFKENICLALTKDQCGTNIILNFQHLRRHAYAAKIETRTMEPA